MIASFSSKLSMKPVVENMIQVSRFVFNENMRASAVEMRPDSLRQEGAWAERRPSDFVEGVSWCSDFFSTLANISLLAHTPTLLSSAGSLCFQHLLTL